MAHRLDFFNGWIRGGLASVVLMVISLEPCQAARLTQILTSQDLAQPLLLDQNGNPLAMSQGRRADLTAGSIPTYMAYSLHGGEHLPPGLAVIAADPTNGSGAVGPLDFSQAMKTEIDAALASSRAAEVSAPSGNYLIAILPRRMGALLPPTPATTPPAVTTTFTPATTATSTMTNGLLPGPLGSWLNSDTSKLVSWTNQGLTDLETLLNLKRDKTLARSRATATKPSLNLEAQVLSPFTPAPAPIPEPGTWVSFGIILGAVATTGRCWNRKRADSQD